MRLERVALKKTCSFYISEFHLSTLLLPYITTKIKNNVQIYTFFEEGIKECIEKVVGGISIEEYVKKEILKINWEKFELIKYAKISEEIDIEDRDINVIVKGNKNYIENVNINLDKLIKGLNLKGLDNKIEITINNCYQVRDVLSVKEVLDKHDLLLNTAGEVEIGEVFKDYKINNIADCHALRAGE